MPKPAICIAPTDRIRADLSVVRTPLPPVLVETSGLAAAAAEPVSTTSLVATTGLSLATISGHLRVLTDAGLLERRRSGRSVLYWQSGTGRRVVGRR